VLQVVTGTAACDRHRFAKLLAVKFARAYLDTDHSAKSIASGQANIETLLRRHYTETSE